jgi:hypothetical protein
MAETLGTLCDKLTIVKLKQFHTEAVERLKSLSEQQQQLQDEMDQFIKDAVSGEIPINKLSFKANKVFKQEGNQIENITGSIAEVFAKLAEVNCKLWHEQEKVYEFETVAPEEKNAVIKKLAIYNLERNQCIDQIDASFVNIVKSIHND